MVKTNWFSDCQSKDASVSVNAEASVSKNQSELTIN